MKNRNAKHTPGPWLVYTVGESEGFGICTERTDKMEINITEGTPIIREADARLMAAGPDLLKALEELNQAIVAHIKPGELLVDKRLCKAHVAALKAMGRAKSTGGAE